MDRTNKKDPLTTPWATHEKLKGQTRAEKKAAANKMPRPVFTPEERMAQITGDYRQQDPPPTGLKITNDSGEFMPKHKGDFRSGDLAPLNLNYWSFSKSSRESSRQREAQTERGRPRYPPGYTQVARLMAQEIQNLEGFDPTSSMRTAQPPQKVLTERQKYGLGMKGRKFLLDEELMQAGPGTHMYNVAWKAQQSDVPEFVPTFSLAVGGTD